jgi:vacuolar-type H+-ATPase subunit E/Vma4
MMGVTDKLEQLSKMLDDVQNKLEKADVYFEPISETYSNLYDARCYLEEIKEDIEESRKEFKNKITKIEQESSGDNVMFDVIELLKTI